MWSNSILCSYTGQTKTQKVAVMPISESYFKKRFFYLLKLEHPRHEAVFSCHKLCKKALPSTQLSEWLSHTSVRFLSPRDIWNLINQLICKYILIYSRQIFLVLNYPTATRCNTREQDFIKIPKHYSNGIKMYICTTSQQRHFSKSRKCVRCNLVMIPNQYQKACMERNLYSQFSKTDQVLDLLWTTLWTPELAIGEYSQMGRANRKFCTLSNWYGQSP